MADRRSEYSMTEPVEAPARQRSVLRGIQRHLVPRWISSCYFLLKDGVWVHPSAYVQSTSRIAFGRGTVVKPFAVIQTWTGRIVFGRGCAVSSFNHISTGTEDLVVGDFVRIAPSVTLLGGTRTYGSRERRIVDQASINPGLRIGSDVLIGANSVVLPGCHIGEGAVVGAGSVVTSEVPPYAIVAGSPARIVGERT
jgi:acetyltransferase-like isoleucine patch superfamily enzyme